MKTSFFLATAAQVIAVLADACTGSDAGGVQLFIGQKISQGEFDAAVFVNCQLNGVTITNSQIVNSDIQNSFVNETSISNCTGSQNLFGLVAFQDSDFSNLIMDHSLAQSSNLDSSTITHSDFQEVDLSNSFVSDDAHLQDMNIDFSVIEDSDISFCTLTSVNVTTSFVSDSDGTNNRYASCGFMSVDAGGNDITMDATDFLIVDVGGDDVDGLAVVPLSNVGSSDEENNTDLTGPDGPQSSDNSSAGSNNSGSNNTGSNGSGSDGSGSDGSGSDAPDNNSNTTDSGSCDSGSDGPDTNGNASVPDPTDSGCDSDSDEQATSQPAARSAKFMRH